MNLPETAIEWLRFWTAMTGISAFGLLTYRLVGRHYLMTWLQLIVIALLTAAVLAFGLGAARAEQLHAPYNELAIIGLLVNIGSTIAGLFWHRWNGIKIRPAQEKE